VELAGDLERIAAAALPYGNGRGLTGVLAAEPARGVRIYLCAFGESDAERAWIALDDAGEPVPARRDVRDAVSIAALCEVAEDAAGGGKLEELRAQLVALRLTENPEGIEEAEEAALELERTIGAPPRLATPAFLDAVGAATRRLEQSLSDDLVSPFVEVMKGAPAVAAELERDVLGGYKVELS